MATTLETFVTPLKSECLGYKGLVVPIVSDVSLVAVVAVVSVVTHLF